jgi:2,4-dienoyl-CoA reductase-like NADH-dependent reductase (Old Yellow Enzyme family)
MASLDPLWEPIEVGSLTLKNRVIQSAHDQSWADSDHLLNERHVRYWEERARGGAALVITGAQLVHRSSLGHLASPSEGWRPEVVPRYRALAEAVHRYGCAVFVQLGHWGVEDDGTTFLDNFRELWGPSEVGSAIFGDQPRPLEAEDIAALVEGYAATAAHAQEAGCDGVEFHSAHGYLGLQFMSPLYNQREDRYGGSTENRCRFAIEAAEAIRERCGRDFPLGIRLSFDEKNPSGAGVDPEEAERILRVLDATGLYDYFNVSAGNVFTIHEFIAPMTSGVEAPFAGFARRAKEIVGVPVFMAGRVTDVERAAELVAAGDVDVVARTRGHIADPEIVNKAREGRADEIRRCAGINQGCIKRIFVGREMSCTQNPVVGRELEWGEGSLRPAAEPKRVVVVGGGPAGLKAAEIAATRGHRVVLFEREPELGGQLRHAAALPQRSEWRLVYEHLAGALERLEVELRLGVEADAAALAAEAPDEVVLATGSRWSRDGWSIVRGPDAGIPGLEQVRVLDPVEAIGDPAACGASALIVAEHNGYTPLGLAELLAARGTAVHLVSRQLMIGEEIVPSLDLPWVMPRLAALGVRLLPQSLVAEVSAAGEATVVGIWGAGEERIAVDSIVLVMGRKPETELFRALRDRFDGTPVRRIGDCLSPREVDRAIYEGEKVGRAL